MQGSSVGSASGTAAGYSRQFVGAANTVHFHADTTQLRHDRDLPCVKNARFNSIADRTESPYCLPNTRAQILQEIENWANDREGPCIFWMSGLAGTGKSTIARTIARNYDSKNRLGASFFFSVLNSETRRSASFVTTIARQLADVNTSLRDEINKAIRQRSDISSYALEDQWRHLILDPLARVKIETDQPPYVLVIDALDECETTPGIATILRLLAQTRSPSSSMLRIFLTSRPDTRIEANFDDIPEDRRRSFKLHSIDDEVVNHDISLFLAHRFRIIAKHHYQEKDWPGADTVNLLTQKAGGLFIWAAVACKFVGSDSRFSRQRLIQLLDDSSSPDDPKSELDKIYITVLCSTVSERHTADEKSFIYSIVRLILGTMAVLVSPLLVNDLGTLFQSEPLSCRTKRPELKGIHSLEIHLNLRHLSAIVDLPKDDHQPPRLHHPTLREFLLDKERCTVPLFHVDKRQTHLTLAGCCVNIMFQSWERCPLGRGIFGLDNPGVAVDDVSPGQLKQWLPAALRYACLYWVHHLQQGDAKIHRNDSFDRFLRTHLLHWLEALAWMDKLSDGIRAISSLESMTHRGSIGAFIHDAKRFALYSRPTIQSHPLQIYVSALVFAPTKSAVRFSFEKEALRWMHRVPSITSNWSPTLQNLGKKIPPIKTFAFSTCGKLLASGARREMGGTVAIWEPATGELLQTFELPGWPRYIGFLGEEERLVVVSDIEGRDNYHIQQRDPWTGEFLQASSIPLGYGVFGAIVWSKGGSLLTFMNDSHILRDWDVLSGACTQQLICDEFATYVVSKDASILASTTYSGSIRVWKIYNGQCLPKLHIQGQPALIKPALSKNGTILAVISDYTMLQIWDLTTDDLSLSWALQDSPITNIGSDTHALVISDDGKLLASSFYGHIQLWDIKTGRCFQAMQGTYNCEHMATSPDSQMLATCSGSPVRLWDLTSRDIGVSHPSLKQNAGITDIGFSPNGLLAVLASDWQLYIWDSVTETCLSRIQRHGQDMHEFNLLEALEALLPDPKIQFWLDAAGDQGLNVVGNRGFHGTLTFSDDEKFLLAWIYPHAALWDIAAKRCLLTVDLKAFTASQDSNTTKSLRDTMYIVLDFLVSLEEPDPRFSRDDAKPKLTVEGDWILRGAQKLVRLPPDYGVFECAMAFNDKIAVCYHPEVVFFLDL